MESESADIPKSQSSASEQSDLSLDLVQEIALAKVESEDGTERVAETEAERENQSEAAETSEKEKSQDLSSMSEPLEPPPPPRREEVLVNRDFSTYVTEPTNILELPVYRYLYPANTELNYDKPIFGEASMAAQTTTPTINIDSSPSTSEDSSEQSVSKPFMGMDPPEPIANSDQDTSFNIVADKSTSAKSCNLDSETLSSYTEDTFTSSATGFSQDEMREINEVLSEFDKVISEIEAMPSPLDSEKAVEPKKMLLDKVEVKEKKEDDDKPFVGPVAIVTLTDISQSTFDGSYTALEAQEVGKPSLPNQADSSNPPIEPELIQKPSVEVKEQSSIPSAPPAPPALSAPQARTVTTARIMKYAKPIAAATAPLLKSSPLVRKVNAVLQTPKANLTQGFAKKPPSMANKNVTKLKSASPPSTFKNQPKLNVYKNLKAPVAKTSISNLPRKNLFPTQQQMPIKKLAMTAAATPSPAKPKESTIAKNRGPASGQAAARSVQAPAAKYFSLHRQNNQRSDVPNVRKAKGPKTQDDLLQPYEVAYKNLQAQQSKNGSGPIESTSLENIQATIAKLKNLPVNKMNALLRTSYNQLKNKLKYLNAATQIEREFAKNLKQKVERIDLTIQVLMKEIDQWKGHKNENLNKLNILSKETEKIHEDMSALQRFCSTQLTNLSAGAKKG